MLAFAQGTTSRISGVVTDASGAVVPGATVTATNDTTGATFTTRTSGSGTYAFESLQIGPYTIKVEKAGFKSYASTGNVLSIGVPTNVNPKMELGSAAETVDVQGGYDLVQTESSGNFGGIIDNTTLTQLPVVGTRGRNPVGLVQFMPGVVVNGANATGGGINVNGSRDRAWNYVLDGIDANESSSGGSNTSPPHQNPDMLAEFRVITSNPTAEFGRNSGAQVLMVTKSGTNKLHGNLFWFYQSPFLRANTPQNKAVNQGRSQFVQNIPGGSIGGPIWRDKAFFFFNIELLHALSSSLVTRSVYTSAARQGLFRYSTAGRNQPAGSSAASVDASGNPIVPFNTFDIPGNDPFHVGLDPTVTAFLNQAPLPNNFASGDGLNYAGFTFVAPSTDKQVDVTVKVDYRFNEKNTIFARYMGGHQNTYADITNAGQQVFPGGPAQVNTFRIPRNFAFNWRYSPTEKLTNEFVVGMNRFGYRFENPAIATTQQTPYNFNLVTEPVNSYLGNNRFLTTYQIVDNITYVHGAHIIKGGINFRYGREIDERGSVGSLNAIPQVTFSASSSVNQPDPNHYGVTTGTSGINTTYDVPNLNSAINDLLGRVGTLQAGYIAKPDLSAFRPAGTLNIMDHRWPEYDFYVQDTWHMTPRLVLDYGLRLDARSAPDFHTLPGLVPNQIPRYGAPLTQTLQFVPGKYMDSRWTNFGPSVGFAYDVFGNGNTSVRGNFRIAYDRINSFSFSSSVFQGMPGLTYQISNSTAGHDTFCATGSPASCTDTMGMRAQGWAPPAPTQTPTQLLTPPTYSTNSLTVSDPANMQTPTVSMWGLSIQQKIAKATVFTISYIGNHGTHLYGGYDSNQSETVSNGFLAAFQQIKAGQDSPLMTQIVSHISSNSSHMSGLAFLNTSAWKSYLTNNNVAGLADTFAKTINSSGNPLVVDDGLAATFFKPYSQYLGSLIVLQTRDYSNYNGLQMQLDRRFTDGLSLTVNYTYSKSLDNRSFDPAFTTVATGSSQSAAGTPFDYHTPGLNYAAADFDNTHVINGFFVADLPFGHKRKFGANWNRLVDEVLGGWQLTGAGNWQSGRPLTLFSGSYTYRGSVQSTPVCTGKCNGHMGHVHFETANANTWFFTPEQRAQFSIPVAGQEGNMGRNWLRQNATWNMDTNLSKAFRTFHEQTLQLRFEAHNIFNTRSYDTMGSQTITSSVFTRLNAGTDGVTNTSPRNIQLAAKYVF